MVFKQLLTVYLTEMNYRQHLELRNCVIRTVINTITFTLVVDIYL